MELKYLNTFRAIVEGGSFTAAAEKLNYTQSAITFQIDRLERELSVRLFEKIGRKMVLTKAGEQLVPYVDEVLLSLERLRSFEDNLAECGGDLYVGVGESILCYLMPPVLKEFHRRAPNARLFLRSMNCYEIRNELIGGSLDLGVFYEDVGGFGTSLAARPFGNRPLALVASPETARSCPDFITPDRRLSVPFIINEQNCVYRLMLEKYFSERSIIIDRTIELWSIPTIKNMLKSDIGFSFLPKFTVEEELRNGELVEIPTAIAKTSVTSVCACHKNKWISPIMQLFIDLCAPQENLK